MKLFNVDLRYAASRYTKKRNRTRVEYGNVRMVVMALDQADAIARAEAWFRHQLTQPALARITFGTGIRDADPAHISLVGETWASECDLPHIAIVSLR